jgi:zona occludens toxin (predicted ATPase)
MIIGYVGTPGSGKTYEAVKTILSNLKKGTIVYTNIEGLEKPICREMIKNVCGLADVAMERQLKILEPDQLDNFWNHIEPESMVVIDEVQKVFSSREWQSDKNKHFGFWASTHRSLWF